MQIKYVLFDMDNTLYPASSGIQTEIGRRINQYTAQFLKISEEECHQTRKGTVQEYGTTLKWLQVVHNFQDIEDYMEQVHPKNISDFVGYNQTLDSMLSSLTQRRSVLTNAPLEHAERVLATLGIKNQFEKVFDIRYFGFRGKPYSDCYTKTLDQLGIEASTTLFLDDHPLCLEGFRKLGGQVLLVHENLETFGEDYPVIRRVEELNSYLEP